MKTKYKEGELLEFNEKRATKLFGLAYTEMVCVEKGTFNIGDNNSGINNEKEATITFDSGYFIGKYPVTQEFYEYITGKNPSHFKGKYRPVEYVSWDDICIGDDCFIKQLNAQIKDKYPLHTGDFVLPSEAQWEYAARGGKAWDKPKLQYSGSNNIHDVAWFSDNSNIRTMPVGLKQPNVLKLYDMSGNIYEWCQDFYEENYNKKPKNGKTFEQSGTQRILRGGRWAMQIMFLRATCRNMDFPSNRFGDYGFRLAYLPV